MVRRITYVVHQFLPRYFTGTEQYTFAIARAMRRRGHDVEVLALEPDFSERQPFFEWSTEEVEGVRVERIRYWMLLDRSFERLEFDHPVVAERVRRHLERSRPDVLHVLHLRHLGADVLAEAKVLGVPTVVHLMDFWFLCPAVTLMRGDGSLCDGPPEGGIGCIDCVAPALGRELGARELRDVLRATRDLLPWSSAPSSTPFGRARSFVERPTFLRDRLLRATKILAPSSFLRERFVANGYPRERIDVLSYGIDVDRLASQRAKRASRRAGDVLRCAFLGSIAPHKGTDVAVEAVLRAGDGVSLSVRGRVEDFPEFSGALMGRAGGDVRITFDGPFARERLGDVLADTDVLLVPSRWYENTPFVVLEAFAAGVPVVASDLGGLSELVTDGVNGELFAAGDVGELVRRLQRLRDEPARLDRYRAAAPHVKRLDENAGEIEAIYAELWSRAHAAPNIPRDA